MAMLMEKLKIPIPVFTVKRQIKLILSGNELIARELQSASSAQSLGQAYFCDQLQSNDNTSFLKDQICQ